MRLAAAPTAALDAHRGVAHLALPASLERAEPPEKKTAAPMAAIRIREDEEDRACAHATDLPAPLRGKPSAGQPRGQGAAQPARGGQCGPRGVRAAGAVDAAARVRGRGG